jgi:drug/metabolite transporter (DMT)-like permease
MDRIASPNVFSPTVRGALFMLAAGVAYAVVNVATQWLTQSAGVPSTAVAFYQYFFALCFTLPWIWQFGLKSFRTKHPVLQILRAVLSAIGVQAFISALSVMPVAQVIALVMTSPFFVVAGAGLFLREKITVTRIIATLVGFCGAVLILEPWSAGFSGASLLPVVAAASWAAVSLMTKRLTRDETPEAITVYLLALLTPINALWFGLSGFVAPDWQTLLILLGLGLITAGSQYFLARAYAVADAAYLQPFDDLKLPLNVLLGWIVFSFAPSGFFWPGAALIVAASIYIATRENRQQAKNLAGAKAIG